MYCKYHEDQDWQRCTEGQWGAEQSHNWALLLGLKWAPWRLCPDQDLVQCTWMSLCGSATLYSEHTSKQIMAYCSKMASRYDFTRLQQEFCLHCALLHPSEDAPNVLVIENFRAKSSSDDLQLGQAASQKIICGKRLYNFKALKRIFKLFT